VFKGKVGYASPELAEGEPIDHRSDQFSAGVVLHEALTGRRLFKGSSDLQTLALVRKAIVASPSQRNPRVPSTLDHICARALARRPDDRFATCDEMAAALDQVVHELGWGPTRLAALLAELEPEATSPPIDRLDGASVLATTPAATIRPRPIRRLALAGAIVLAVGAGAAIAIEARGGDADVGAARSPSPPPGSTAGVLPSPSITAPPAAATAPPVSTANTALDPAPRAPAAVAASPSPPAPARASPSATAHPTRSRVHHDAGESSGARHHPSAGSAAASQPAGEPPDLKAGAIVDPFHRDGVGR
jgi:serine/threonine-protein kinase